MHILDKIVAKKKLEIEERKTLYPVALLEKSLYFESPTVSLSKYVQDADRSGVIAEFKRKSPSKGVINGYASVEEVTIGYMQAGASALSILTDNHFFGGSSQDLQTARDFNFCPILRKDFTIDEYQIIEAKSIGADAILLIAELLEASQIQALSATAHQLGLEVLMELHSKSQIAKIDAAVDLIGVNNRDLTTFETSIQTSKDLASQLPAGKTYVSESGISDPTVIAELRSYGYRGFLIGEHFMTNAQPHKACRQFIRQIRSNHISSNV